MKLEPLEIKSDRRGTLVEAFGLPNDGGVFYVIARAGAVRGNHYHLEKTEHFLVIYGSAIISVKDRVTNNVITADVSGNKPMVVSIHPNHTHNIVANNEGAIFMVWVDKKFNADEPDTYPEEI